MNSLLDSMYYIYVYFCDVLFDISISTSKYKKKRTWPAFDFLENKNVGDCS